MSGAPSSDKPENIDDWRGFRRRLMTFVLVWLPPSHEEGRNHTELFGIRQPITVASIVAFVPELHHTPSFRWHA